MSNFRNKDKPRGNMKLYSLVPTSVKQVHSSSCRENWDLGPSKFNVCTVGIELHE